MQSSTSDSIASAERPTGPHHGLPRYGGSPTQSGYPLSIAILVGYRSPVATLPPLPPGICGDAHFSHDHRFRYWLERRWDDALPQFTYVLLNPSAAGGDRDDPTNRKLRALTIANGGGGYELVNLFALVDTHQERLHYPEAIGETREANDAWIVKAVEGCDVLVLGWGEGNGSGAGAAARKAAVRRRAREVWPLVRYGHPKCFNRNESGSPGHPGRLKNGSSLSGYVPTPAYLDG